MDDGTVMAWNPEEGYGSIAINGSEIVCFAHFSCIAQQNQEFLELLPGEHVRLTWHQAQQDDFSAVADRVERSGSSA
ncbi:cold-shock protein [Paenarthrobacter sp. NPDC089989]|uniref:cold-shock protein n=1 Tax=unclassified Paenarthrobacter TaxID=2634190 RepID=UPI0038115937